MITILRNCSMTLSIAYSIIQVFGIVALGWVVRHLGYIRDEEDVNRWSRLVLDFLMPALFFDSITNNLEVDRLGEFWMMPLVAFGMIAFGAVMGIALRRGVRSCSPDLVRTFHHCCAVNNYNMLSIVIVGNLWGESALAWLFFFNLSSSMGYWTIGVGLLGATNLRTSWRRTVSPSLVAIVAALLFSLTGWTTHVPGVLLAICGSVGKAAVPCYLITIGAGIYPFPSLRHGKSLLYLTIVRLVLLPVLTVSALMMLPLGEDVQSIAFVVALMPTAVGSTILARRYGGDPDFAAAAVLVTTAASLVTVPLGLGVLIG